jgi:hypothetical protein
MSGFFNDIGFVLLLGMVEVVWVVFQHIGLTIAALIVAATVFLFVVVTRRAIRDNGFWLSKQGHEAIRWLDCETCESCGVVMMDGKPIPKPWRTFSRELKQTQGPLANTKTCGDCLGMGGGWYADDGKKRHNVIDK